jgi:hypothetical protein
MVVKGYLNYLKWEARMTTLKTLAAFNLVLKGAWHY